MKIPKEELKTLLAILTENTISKILDIGETATPGFYLCLAMDRSGQEVLFHLTANQAQFLLCEIPATGSVDKLLGVKTESNVIRLKPKLKLVTDKPKKEKLAIDITVAKARKEKEVLARKKNNSFLLGK